MKRPEKEAVVAQLTDKFRNADAIYLTEYRGLTVPQISELREKLGRDTSYTVAKNTLVRIAAKEAGIEGLDEILAGPTAVTFVKGDFIEAAKTLRDFAKTNPALVIKGGLLGDKALDEAAVKALADVEPREVLLAKLAGAMAAPMVQFAGLLEALPRNFAYGLKALIDQGGAPGAPADAPTVAEAPAEAPAPEAEAADETPAAEDSAPADTTETDQAEESAATEQES